MSVLESVDRQANACTAHWLKVILNCCILWDCLVPGIPFADIMVLLEPVWGPGLLVLLETSLKS